MNLSLSRYVGTYAAFSFVCAVLVATRPLNFIADDGLFYLIIAEHIVSGHGSTFNGLFPTNGYHPLWECIATLLALIPHDRPLLLAYGVLVQWMLNVATLVILLKALRTSLSPAGLWTFCALMLFFFVPFGNLFWSEAPVSMLFIAATLYMLLSPKPLSYPALGIVLGFAFLSRLDNVFFIGFVFLGLWWRDRDLRLGIALVTCAAIAAVYLITNMINFGHLVPISGAIKSALYWHHYFEGRLGSNGLMSLAGGVSLAAINIAQRARPKFYRTASLVLSAGVILQSLYVWALTYGDTTWPWYYVQGFLCIALAVGQCVDSFSQRYAVNVARVLFIASFAISVAIAAAKFLVNWSLHDPKALAGRWREAWITEIERDMPNDSSVLVVLDQPGLFAYSMTHPVFALDGLTMNHRFAAILAERGMYTQLHSFGISYFIAPVVAVGEELRTLVIAQRGIDGGQILHFTGPLGGTDAGCIMMDDAALVTKRAVPPVIQGGVWGLWKLTTDTIRPVSCPADLQVAGID